jgi:hypothetical protein
MADVFHVPTKSPRRKAAGGDCRIGVSIAQAEAAELMNWDAAEKWIESGGTKDEVRRPELKRR